MAKINLSEKIKITVAGFGILSCLYFIIAAWLKSDGVHFNPSLTYELLKDTLTLGAAFLAPIAAFVLFSDWRSEHIEKKIEADSELIIKDIDKIYTKLLEVRLGMCLKETQEEGMKTLVPMDQLTTEILKAKNSVNLLKDESNMVKKFITESHIILDSLNDVNNKFYCIQKEFCNHEYLVGEHDYPSPLHLATEELRGNTHRISSLHDTCKKLRV